MKFFLVQLLGAVGYTLLAFSYFKKDKKDILYIQIFAYIMFCLHYYFLSGFTGAVCNLIGLISLIIIYLFDKHKLSHKKILISCMIPLMILISLTTYKDIISIFPIMAVVLAVSSFLTNSENLIRKIGILSALCWLIYAFFYKSYVSIIYDAIVLIFIIRLFELSSNRSSSS